MNDTANIKRINAQLLLLVFAAVLVTGIWTMTLLELRESRRMIEASAEQDARNMARLFEEHANRTIDSADQTVKHLRQRYNMVGKSLEIGQDLREGLNPDDIFTLFSIVDEHGDVVVSSQPFGRVNLLDREHIHVHLKDDGDQLFVSKPLLGRVSKKWSIQITRRISYPDGAFKGVVVASLNPSYFTDLYHDIDVGKYGAITLLGEDGVVRVRRVGSSDSMGQDISGDALFKAMRATGEGLVRMPIAIDGRERFYAYRKLKRAPLYVVVGIDSEERLAAYHAARKQALISAALRTTVILLFIVSIMVLVRRLAESRQRALIANEAKSRFLSNMSHELRTPLNGILGFSEVLRDELGASELGGFAQSIHASGLRLLKLVESAMQLSALESDAVTLSSQRENLYPLLEQAIHRHQAGAAAKALSLTLEIDAEVPAEIDCDGARLSQALDCLLDNAIAFTKQGGVRLTVSASSTHVLFAVADSGIGIPPEQQARIFEKFSQGDESATRVKQGAGLGLPIAARLVELMGGRISLQSAPGSGSVFSFSLPITLSKIGPPGAS